MKSWTALTALAGAGLNIATFALAGCTAETSTGTAVAASAPAAKSAQYRAGDVSRHTLVLKDADGHVLRLIHYPRYGWRFLTNEGVDNAARNASFKPVALTPLLSAHAQNDAASESNSLENAHPMAVFIDGPTGYTFAWTGEAGWQYVGSLGDEQHE